MDRETSPPPALGAAARTDGHHRGGRRPHRDHTAPAWTQEALARYAQLLGRLPFVEPPEARDKVKHVLTTAHATLDDPSPRGLRGRLANWWNGDRIERTWAWLEEAEIEIVEHSNEQGLRIALGITVQRAENALPEKDPRRVALETLAAASDAREGPSGIPRPGNGGAVPGPGA